VTAAIALFDRGWGPHIRLSSSGIRRTDGRHGDELLSRDGVDEQKLVASN
jgi:hypothetical protein